jgi:GMP synthase-like glutamine amidotransferase
MAPRLLVLQHIACEPPGAYEDELRARGGDLERVEVDAGEPLPDWRDFDGLIVMGGPMGAYEQDGFPWLTAEKQLMAEAASAGAPIWGICLGSQLLAASLGARVELGPEPEVGVLDVHCTAAAASDPVFAQAPATFKALQWHQDTFALPPGATHLASSPAYPHQAFRYGRAYGLQFHIEVDTALATEWGEVPAYAASLDRILGPGSLPGLIDDISAHEPEMTGLARRLFAAWLEHVVATAGSEPSPLDPAVSRPERAAPPSPVG